MHYETGSNHSLPVFALLLSFEITIQWNLD